VNLLGNRELSGITQRHQPSLGEDELLHSEYPKSIHLKVIGAFDTEDLTSRNKVENEGWSKNCQHLGVVGGRKNSMRERKSLVKSQRNKTSSRRFD